MTALDDIFAQAAEARAAGVRATADRPSQRRNSEDAHFRTGPALVRAPAQLEVRAAAEGDGLHFSGFASVYDRGYEMWDMFGPYTEQVLSGAGAASLSRDDLDVPLVLNHDSLRRIARTTNGSLTLSEKEIDGVTGLHADAPNLDRNDHDVAYIAPKLEAGLVDEMSFRFRITSGEWSPDWLEYHINEYDIQRGDVAIVGYGANPHTQGAGLRSAGAILPALASLDEADLRKVSDAVHAQLRDRGAVKPSMTFAALDRLLQA